MDVTAFVDIEISGPIGEGSRADLHILLTCSVGSVVLS